MPPRCNICGHAAGFINPEHGKEGWQCRNCAASSRNRLVTYLLGRLLGHSGQPAYAWPQNKALSLLEPCPRGPQTAIFRDKFDYTEPEFDRAKIDAGADPRDYADLEALAFPDGTFDYIIASDVFEHVRHDLRGFREIHRTLKPGGAFLFTSPYSHQREHNLVRVQVEGDRDIPLVAERYAGGGGVTLDYREYGREVLGQLQQIGFAVAYFEAAVPQHQIHPSPIILCRKAPYLELSTFLPGSRETDSGYASAGWLLPNRLFVWYKWNLRNAAQLWRDAKRKRSG